MEMTYYNEDVLEFKKIFPDDDSCRKFIANEKWKDGYKCKRCDNTKYVYFEKHNIRECTKCRYNESPTTGTLFHNVRFGLQKAFCIVFEMTCTNQVVSSIQIAKRYEITQKTAWLFKQKVKLALKTSKKNPVQGKLRFNELVIGKKEIKSRGLRNKKVTVSRSVLSDEVEVNETMQMLLMIIMQPR